MKKTKIEWCDYSVNPIKGICPIGCSYCYAIRLYRRFRWNPEIRFEGVVNLSVELLNIKKPSKIFVGSTMELFGEWIYPHWMDIIFEATKLYSQHTFIFLTKQPQNLIKWSPFPSNTYIGVSVTNHEQLIKAQVHLAEIEASVKFVSIEPILPELETLPEGYWLGLFEVAQWAILGSQTQPVRHPKKERVKLIIDCADYSKIPVFIKEPLASYLNVYRKEMPNIVKE